MSSDQEFVDGDDGVGADAPTAADVPQGQPTSNLDDDPRFRQFKSNADRRLAEADRARKAAEDKLDQTAMAGMDRVEKAEYLAEKNAREAAGLRDQLASVQADAYRRQRLSEMATKYGVPMDRLDDSSPEAALESALDYLSVSGKGGGRSRDTTDLAPRTDLGGGSPKGAAERMKERYREAKKNNDASALLQIAMQAQRDGVSLD